MTLTQLSLNTGQTRVRVGCHRLAYSGPSYERTGYVLGLHGPESSLRAVRAVLCDPSIKGTLEWHYDPDEDCYSRTLRRAESGYRCHKHRLAENTWEFTFVAEDPALLLSTDDESLWRALMSERHTTPLVREWLSLVRTKLEKQKLLVPLQGDSTCALLTATTEHLDRIVTDGLKNRLITIPERRAV